MKTTKKCVKFLTVKARGEKNQINKYKNLNHKIKVATNEIDNSKSVKKLITQSLDCGGGKHILKNPNGK